MNTFLVILLLLYAGAMTYSSLKQELLIRDLSDDLKDASDLKGFNSQISHTSISRIEKDLNALALTKCGVILDVDIIVDTPNTRVYLADTDHDVTDEIESIILNERSL